MKYRFYWQAQRGDTTDTTTATIEANSIQEAAAKGQEIIAVRIYPDTVVINQLILPETDLYGTIIDASCYSCGEKGTQSFYTVSAGYNYKIICKDCALESEEDCDCRSSLDGEDRKTLDNLSKSVVH